MDTVLNVFFAAVLIPVGLALGMMIAAFVGVDFDAMRSSEIHLHHYHHDDEDEEAPDDLADDGQEDRR